MSSKVYVHVDEELKYRKGRVLSLLRKVYVLDELDRGSLLLLIRFHCGKPVICFVKKNEDKIRGNIRSSASSSAKIYCVNCGLFLKMMERAIFISLEDGDGSCHGTV